MPLDTSGTILVLTGIGLPNYSARGLTQTLKPIDAARQMLRSINGSAVDLAAPQFQKYKSTISGTDVQPIAYDGHWPGKIITVDCIPTLAYLTSGGSPARPVVAGSSYTEGAFTFYRPQLTMIVIDFEDAMAEWKHDRTWKMDLEEI